MGMAEVLVLTPITPGHLDALVHVPVDGLVYPELRLADAVNPAGVRHGSTTAFADGVLTRGVLFDLAPGDRLPPAHRSPAPTSTTRIVAAGCAWSPATPWWFAAGGRSRGAGEPRLPEHQRLGHHFGGVMGTYSQVTRPMITDLLAALQARWEQTGSTIWADHFGTPSVACRK
jgi:hypothetical protein